MKIPTNPPQTVPLRDWNSFQAATENELFSSPQVAVVETWQDYQDLQRRLQMQVRPFAVALITPKS